jgi:thiol-disulfide isomerase/thioredoxin
MDTSAPDPSPAVPRSLSSIEPPPRRPFAWGTFFLGVGTGVFVTGLVLVAGIVGLVMIGKSLVAEDSVSDTTLSAPTFPAAGKLSIYGEAEPTWKVYTLSGAPTTLGEYRGKVVFVNFWATWCGPCVAEMPSIQRLQEKMKDTPVQFLLVSDEDPATIEKFVKKKLWTLQSFHGDGKPPSVFHTIGIPATFIVNPSGMVVYRHIGGARWDADEVVEFLRGLS